MCVELLFVQGLNLNCVISAWYGELLQLPVSKKIPPRKGRKKRSMMASEKPSSCM